MRWLIPIALILPAVLLSPVVFGSLGVLVYLLIPVMFFLMYVRRNLHWGGQKRKRGKYSRMEREQRAKDRLIRSLKLDPEEEKVVRSQIVIETLKKLERR